MQTRKDNRLKTFSYDTPGAYFITVCTAGRAPIFWEPVGAVIGRPEDVPLSEIGHIVDTSIQDISGFYPAVSVDHYVVMPNHIHLLLQKFIRRNGIDRDIRRRFFCIGLLAS